MSSVWSDDASTVLDDSLYDNPIDSMEKAIKAERDGKDLAIIAIVSRGIRRKLATKTRKRWWQVWKGDSLVSVTTLDGFQDSITEATRDGKRRRLMIMASVEVTQIIRLKIPSTIRKLTILRCGHDGDPGGCLHISGSSTFGGVRMSQFQQEYHRHHKVFLGPGVRLKASSEQAEEFFKAFQGSSGSQHDDLRRHLGRMKNAKGYDNWWQRWKGPVAAILAILTTSGKIALEIKTSAWGFYVGTGAFQAGVFKGGASVCATAAGPAVLLGAAVGLGAYFIPWESVLDWFGKALKSFWDWIMSFFSELKNWLQGANCRARGRTRVPMVL